MLVSVIVRSKDEADRLRLVLTSLGRQTVPIVAAGTMVADSAVAAELIIVNDGSTDGTHVMLEEESATLPIRVIHHEQPQGRCAASNAGARLAAGEVLIFMDGDILAGPNLIERHAAAQVHACVLGRGETFHLRCTRFFRDPQTGTPNPGREDHVNRMGAELVKSLVTRKQILEHFEQIENRAQPGIYPGAGPRKLYELELDALQNHPDLSVLWIAASGHNFSVRREHFEAVGGFNESLSINEHRELAFRLCERGVRPVLVSGARSYHLTHQTGWRDPLTVENWEQIFYEAHPCQAVKLMSIFWLSLAEDRAIPQEARIASLPQLESVVQHGSAVDYDAIRSAHPLLRPLGVAGPVETA